MNLISAGRDQTMPPEATAPRAQVCYGTTHVRERENGPLRGQFVIERLIGRGGVCSITSPR